MTIGLYNKKCRIQVSKRHIYSTRKRNRLKRKKNTCTTFTKTTIKHNNQYFKTNNRIFNYGCSVLNSKLSALSFSWYVVIFFQLFLCEFTSGLTSHLSEASVSSNENFPSMDELVFNTKSASFYETIDPSQIKTSIEDQPVHTVFENSINLQPSFIITTYEKSVIETLSASNPIMKSRNPSMHSNSAGTSQNEIYSIRSEKDSYVTTTHFLQISSNSLFQTDTDLPFDSSFINQDIPKTMQTISKKASASILDDHPLSEKIDPTKTINYSEDSFHSHVDNRTSNTTQRLEQESNINQTVDMKSFLLESISEMSDLTVNAVDGYSLFNELHSTYWRTHSVFFSPHSRSTHTDNREQTRESNHIMTSHPTKLQRGIDDTIKPTITSAINVFQTEALQSVSTDTLDNGYQDNLELNISFDDSEVSVDDPSTNSRSSSSKTAFGDSTQSEDNYSRVSEQEKSSFEDGQLKSTVEVQTETNVKSGALSATESSSTLLFTFYQFESAVTELDQDKSSQPIGADQTVTTFQSSLINTSIQDQSISMQTSFDPTTIQLNSNKQRISETVASSRFTDINNMKTSTVHQISSTQYISSPRLQTVLTLVSSRGEQNDENTTSKSLETTVETIENSLFINKHSSSFIHVSSKSQSSSSLAMELTSAKNIKNITSRRTQDLDSKSVSSILSVEPPINVFSGKANFHSTELLMNSIFLEKDIIYSITFESKIESTHKYTLNTEMVKELAEELFTSSHISKSNQVHGLDTSSDGMPIEEYQLSNFHTTVQTFLATSNFLSTAHMSLDTSFSPVFEFSNTVPMSFDLLKGTVSQSLLMSTPPLASNKLITENTEFSIAKHSSAAVETRLGLSINSSDRFQDETNTTEKVLNSLSDSMLSTQFLASESRTIRVINDLPSQSNFIIFSTKNTSATIENDPSNHDINMKTSSVVRKSIAPKSKSKLSKLRSDTSSPITLTILSTQGTSSFSSLSSRSLGFSAHDNNQISTTETGPVSSVNDMPTQSSTIFPVATEHLDSTFSSITRTFGSFEKSASNSISFALTNPTDRHSRVSELVFGSVQLSPSNVMPNQILTENIHFPFSTNTRMAEEGSISTFSVFSDKESDGFGGQTKIESSVSEFPESPEISLVTQIGFTESMIHATDRINSLTEPTYHLPLSSTESLSSREIYTISSEEFKMNDDLENSMKIEPDLITSPKTSYISESFNPDLISSGYILNTNDYSWTSKNKVLSSSFISLVSFPSIVSPLLHSVLPTEISSDRITESAFHVSNTKESTYKPTAPTIHSSETDGSILPQPETSMLKLIKMTSKGYEARDSYILAVGPVADNQYLKHTSPSIYSVFNDKDSISKSIISQSSINHDYRLELQDGIGASTSLKLESEPLMNTIESHSSILVNQKSNMQSFQLGYSDDTVFIQSTSPFIVGSKSWSRLSYDHSFYLEKDRVKSEESFSRRILTEAPSFTNLVDFSNSLTGPQTRPLSEPSFGLSSSKIAVSPKETKGIPSNQNSEDRYPILKNSITLPKGFIISKTMFTEERYSASSLSSSRDRSPAPRIIEDTITSDVLNTKIKVKTQIYPSISGISKEFADDISSHQREFLRPAYATSSFGSMPYHPEVTTLGSISTFTNIDFLKPETGISFNTNGEFNSALRFSGPFMTELLPSIIPTSYSLLSNSVTQSNSDITFKTLIGTPFDLSSQNIISSSLPQSSVIYAPDYFFTIPSRDRITIHTSLIQVNSSETSENQSSLTNVTFISSIAPETKDEGNFPSVDYNRLLDSTPSASLSAMKDLSSMYVIGSLSLQPSRIPLKASQFIPSEETDFNSVSSIEAIDFSTRRHGVHSPEYVSGIKSSYVLSHDSLGSEIHPSSFKMTELTSSSKKAFLNSLDSLSKSPASSYTMTNTYQSVILGRPYQLNLSSESSFSEQSVDKSSTFAYFMNTNIQDNAKRVSVSPSQSIFIQNSQGLQEISSIDSETSGIETDVASTLSVSKTELVQSSMYLTETEVFPTEWSPLSSSVPSASPEPMPDFSNHPPSFRASSLDAHTRVFNIQSGLGSLSSFIDSLEEISPADIITPTPVRDSETVQAILKIETSEFVSENLTISSEISVRVSKTPRIPGTTMSVSESPEGLYFTSFSVSTTMSVLEPSVVISDSSLSLPESIAAVFDTLSSISGTPFSAFQSAAVISDTSIGISEIPISESKSSVGISDTSLSLSESTAAVSDTFNSVSKTPFSIYVSPAGIFNASISLSGTPINIFESLAGTLKTPLSLYEAPISVHESTTVLFDTYVSVSGTPISLSDSTTSVSDTTLSVSETPLSVYESSADVSDTSIRISKSHVSIYDSPVVMSDTSLSLSDSPISKYDSPTRISDTSLSVLEIPYSLYESPSDVSNTPIGSSKSPKLDWISDTSFSLSKLPISIYEQHARISDTSLSVSETYVVVPDKSITISGPSISEPDSAVAESNTPLSVSDVPAGISDISTSSSKTTISIYVAPAGISDSSISVSERPLRLPKSTASLSDTSISVSGKPPASLPDLPTEISETTVRVTKTKFSVYESLAGVSDTSFMLSETPISASDSTGAVSDTSFSVSDSPAGISDISFNLSESHTTESETPLIINKSTSEIFDTSFSISETPISINESPAVVSDTSMGVAESPISICKSLDRISDISSSLSGTPTSVSETPAIVSDTIYMVSGISSGVPHSPAAVYDTSSSVYEKHLSDSGLPADTSNSLSKTTLSMYEPPTGISDTSLTLSRTHISVFDLPAEVSEKSLRVSRASISISNSPDAVFGTSLSISKISSGSSAGISDTSLRIFESFTVVSHKSLRLSETPLSTYDSPVGMSDITLSLSGTPISVYESHDGISDASISSYEAPTSVYETSATVFDVSVSVSGKPFGLSGSPTAVSDTFVRVSETPLSIIESIADVSETSIKVSRTTISISESPDDVSDIFNRVSRTLISGSDSSDTSLSASETSMNVSELSAGVSDTSFRISGTSISVSESLASVNDTSLRVSGAPISMYESPDGIFDTSFSLSVTPTSIYESSAEVSDTSYRISGTSTSVSDSPAEVSDISFSVSGAPLSVSDSSTGLSDTSFIVHMSIFESPGVLSVTLAGRFGSFDSSVRVFKTPDSMTETSAILSKARDIESEKTTYTYELYTSVFHTTAAVSEASVVIFETSTSVAKTSLSVSESHAKVSESYAYLSKTHLGVSESPGYMSGASDKSESVSALSSSISAQFESMSKTLLIPGASDIKYERDTSTFILPSRVFVTTVGVSDTPNTVSETSTIIPATPSTVFESTSFLSKTPSGVFDLSTMVSETSVSLSETPARDSQIHDSVSESFTTGLFISPTSVSETSTSTFETTVIEFSSSIYPTPMDRTNILITNLQMKPSVNINDPRIKQELENGLLECYQEGVNKLRTSTISRKRRQSSDVRSRGIDVEITGIERNVDEPNNVGVEFYMSENGDPLPSTDIENTFNQLSLVEMSAYLGYPVIIRPRPMTKLPNNDEDDDDTLVPLLVIIPIVILIIAILVIVMVIYCCRKSIHSNRMKTRHSMVPSLSLKKPTLDDMDLMIDMEKGEVVSRRSNTSTLNVKPGGSNTNTLSTALQKLEKSGAEKCSELPLRLNTVQYFQRSFSEICSPQDRLERLRSLGLSVTEIHTRTLYQISESNSNGDNVAEVVAEPTKPEESDVDDNIIVDKDGPTPYSSLKTEDLILDISSSDSNPSHPDDQSLIQMDREEQLWNKVTFMANEGYLSDSSPRNKKASHAKRNVKDSRRRHKQYVHNDDAYQTTTARMQTSEDGSTQRPFDRKSGDREAQSSRPTVHGYSNKIFDKPNISSIPNSRKKGDNMYTDIENDSDSVYFPSSTPTWNTDSDSYPHSDFDTESEARFDDMGRLSGGPYSNSLRFDQGPIGHDLPVEVVNDVMYKYFEPKDRLYEIDRDNFYTDGSEYAGYEFDSVNFSSNYKPALTPPHYKYYSQRRKQMEMAEPLVQYPEPSDPSALEHVTKMGRVGSRGLAPPTYKPRFRPIPYQEPRKPPTPDTKKNEHEMDTSNKSCEKNKTTNLRSMLKKESFTVIEGCRLEPELEPEIIQQPETQARPVQLPMQSYEPYEEMKLGRNMRAVPRGGVRAVTSTNMQLDRDASEPLISTNQPSNIVVDYLANTTSSLTAQSAHKNGRPTSHQPSPRSVVTPQHPSQDLIEMLNRNQSMNISRFEEQQRLIEERKQEEDRKAQEQIREQERKEEEERQKANEEIERLERERQEEEWQKQAEIRRMREQREKEYRLEIERKNQEESERKNREIQEERLRQERIEAEKQHERDIQTKNELLRDSFALSPPPQTSKDLYTPNTTQQREKSSDQGSSLPFIPHSGSLNYGTETGGSTLTTKTDTFHGGKTDDPKFDKQETVDEVQDIEEDFEVERASDSDSEEFNHF